MIFKFSDFIFAVDGKELRAHKNILASRSKVFAAMFEHDTEEKRRNRVDIPDLDGAVCQEMLRYIYTGVVESLEQNAAELLIVAEKV